MVLCLVIYAFYVSVSRHRTLMNIFDKAPVVDKDVFVAPGASVIGDVHVGRNSSIWYGCVLRGRLSQHCSCWMVHLSVT